MKSKSAFGVHGGLALAAGVLALASASPARAGGVRDIALASIPLARSPITIDGKLGDWPDARPVSIVPIDAGLAKSGSSALAQLRRQQPWASLQAAYDSQALYFAIVWKGLGQAQGAGFKGGSVELHIQAGEANPVAHIRIAPLSLGRTTSIQHRSDSTSPWRDARASGIASALSALAKGVATEEIRIPWSALGKLQGKPQVLASGLVLGVDLEWPGLTQALIKGLPTEVLHANTHLTACFLTSPSKLFGRDAYLGSPSDWGELKFVALSRGNRTQTSTLATGATEMEAPQRQAPVVAPIVVDGSFKEWDPAQFQTVAYAPGFLGSRYSARIATAFDDKYLYIAIASLSSGGPLNTKAEATQAGYAGGDCLQVRLSDGKHTLNLCGWYDSVTKKPALTADGNDLKNPYLLQQGARESFQIASNNAGYGQEIAVPWALLPSGTAPKVGDAWKGTFQVWWSGLNPQFTSLASASLAPSGGIAVPYSLTREANASLGVYDGAGHLLRTLVKDARRRAGRNTEYWDGKDQFGQAVAPGKYQVRGIEHPPIELQPVVSIGNPGSPPWPTSDGKGDWMSDESPAQGAVTDGTNVYLAAPGSEKGHAIIAVGPDGKRLWGYQESAYPRCVSLALSGKYLYALFSGPEAVHSAPGSNEPDKAGRAFIVCLDKSNGAPALFSTQKTEFGIASWPYVDRAAGLWGLRASQGFTPAIYGGQTRYFANDVGEPTEALGIAAVGGRLYVSMLGQNQLLVLDASTARQIDTISLARPVGLHALSSGKLLGISEGKVVSLDPGSKAVATLVDHDLDAPHDVTTDRAGNLYVSDWGRSFQVKVFSPAGKYLRAIGIAGGRPWIGPWNRNGMLLPRGVAVTDEGQLWVAEDDASPNRVSVWNAASGALVRDYIGPPPYGGGGHFWADPNDASTVLAQGVLFHVDYARKTWTPRSTPYRRMSLAQAFTPNGMNGMPGARTVSHAGRQYVYVSQGGYGLIVFRRDGLLLRPVAAAGSLGRFITDDGTGLAIWDSDIGRHMIPAYYPDFFKGHSGDNYVWSDSSGDGEVQPDEMQWAHTLSRSDKYVAGMLPESTVSWGFGVSPQGSIYLGGFCGDRNVISRLDVQSWLPSGAPSYDLSAARPIVLNSSDQGLQGLFVDAQSHLLVTRPYEWNRSKIALDCYDAEGKLLWSLAAPSGRQQADEFLADNIVGEFSMPNGERILASWLWHGNYKPYLLTGDGLYVTSLLDDTRLGPTSTWDESYKHYFQAPDGTPYIVNGANDAYHISRIVGLDRIRRFAGTISVTQADLQSAASAQAQAAAEPVAKPIIRVSSPQAPPAIDGSLTDWNMSSAVSLRGSKNRSARVALARDGQRLYLAYQVLGARGINKGGNWQTLFTSGDCVDLMLHSGSYKPHFAPAEGDERLLLSIYQGQPIAVLYRPVVAGAKASTRLMGANIDQIVKLSSAKIAIQRSAKGYTLEASVPLSELGLEAATAGTLRGDVGVIYADETGSNRDGRLYYYNQDTAMTADLTTEATLQPGNWGSIEVALGPNLLKNGDFEEPLATTPGAGWAVSAARSGAAATISEASAFSGSHSLLLHQNTAVTFAPESYNLPDYGGFIKSANEGRGGGYVEVKQRVPVVGGKKYTLRFHLRTLDFPGGENKNVGPNRGYASLQSWIGWEGAQGSVWVVNHQDTTPDWKELRDARFNTYGVPLPYEAPQGAKFAVVQFNLSTNFAGKRPKAYLDDVELVEVP